jgi:hypothetical protein
MRGQAEQEQEDTPAQKRYRDNGMETNSNPVKLDKETWQDEGRRSSSRRKCREARWTDDTLQPRGHKPKSPKKVG